MFAALLMLLNQPLQFSGVASMHNLEPQIGSRVRNLGVAHLAKHEIVAALHPVDLAGSGQVLQVLLKMNSNAASGNVHDGAM
jgi:hypothetical protein